jgi:hypothetical protein
MMLVIYCNIQPKVLIESASQLVSTIRQRSKVVTAFDSNVTHVRYQIPSGAQVRVLPLSIVYNSFVLQGYQRSDRQAQN